MIDMYRAKRPAGKLRERAQQAGGIGAAAHSHHESRDVRRKMLAEDGIELRRAEFHAATSRRRKRRNCAIALDGRRGET